MAHIVVREPERVALSIALSGTLRIGRGADNDIVVGDRQASRQHACFDCDPQAHGATVRDAGSRHGTFVNGERLDADARRLADGDVVQIGNVLINFHGGHEPGGQGVLSTFADVAVAAAAGDERRRLTALVRIGAMIGASLEPREAAGRILDEILAALGAERGVVVLGAAACVERARDGQPVIVPRAVAERLTRRRECVLYTPAAGDVLATAARQGVRSALGAPLVDRERVWGFVYVDELARRAPFTQADVALLSALGHLAAAALAELDRARRQDAVAEALRDANPLPELIGESPPIRELREELRRYARAGDTAVLILGESGTGKELVARTLHELSPRRQAPFVAVNCAALPDTLVESELFGHEKGAFTGAARARRGRFLLAHEGTLFLDEIGDLSLAAQAKLLRVLEEGEVQPLGAETARAIDVRVLAATHRRLPDEVAAGRFREDLYYRLCVGEIHVPPLRERGDDIVLLAETFLERAARRLGKRGLRFSPAALAALRASTWPGNVRQLANEIERAAILCDGPEVDVAPRAALGNGPPPVRDLAERFARLDVDERSLIEEALRRAAGNASEAARLLGITRAMLRRRRDRFAAGGDDD